VGYAGGTQEKPTYRDLGDHTESFQVEYDPTQVTFADLLALFWKEHDPTAKAHARQYANILFVHDDEQEREAKASRDALAPTLQAPVRTEIRRLGTFWRAEDYHQKYALRSHPVIAEALRARQASELAFVDDPLVAKTNAWLAGAGDLAELERALPTLGLPEAARTELLETARAAHGRAAACPR
jgi:peptide-methionine (S)-S-oxide reductase